MYFIIKCPNCGNTDVEEINYHEFECECGENFGIERANLEEVDTISY